MQELVTEEEILQFLQKKWHRENPKLYPVLFHGTDYDLVNKEQTELEYIRDTCSEVSKRLFDLFKENGFDVSFYDKRFEGHKDSYGSTNDAAGIFAISQKGNPKYQYGNLYITNGVKRAIDYSEMSWILGEWGWVAYRLYDSAIRLNMDLPIDEKFTDALTVFKERMSREKQPIVLLFADIPVNVLAYENGSSIWPEDKEIQELKAGKSILSYKFIENYCRPSLAHCFIRKENYENLINACKQMGLDGLIKLF